MVEALGNSGRSGLGGPYVNSHKKGSPDYFRWVATWTLCSRTGPEALFEAAKIIEDLTAKIEVVSAPSPAQPDAADAATAQRDRTMRDKAMLALLMIREGVADPAKFAGEQFEAIRALAKPAHPPTCECPECWQQMEAGDPT